MASTTMKLLVPLSTAVVAGAVALGSGAQWTSESATEIKVTGGDILHVTNGAVDLSIVSMKPGASEEAELTIENAGDLNATVEITEDYVSQANTADNFGLLADNSTPSLTRSVTAAWTQSGGGTDTLAAAGAFGDNTWVVETTTADLVLAPGETVTLTFVIALDEDALNADQSAVLDATYTIVTTQTDAADDDETEIEEGWGNDLGDAENPGVDRDESDDDPTP